MKNHKFSELGEYPYTLVGYTYDPVIYDINGGAVGGGQHSCNHCGRQIVHVFHCISSDGKKFDLGSQHAEEVGDDFLAAAIKARMKELRAERRDNTNRLARAEREAKRDAYRKSVIDHNKAEFEKILPKLKATPHPNGYFASKGKTMLDYAEYCCGTFLRQDCTLPANIIDDFWFYNPSLKRIILEMGGSLN